MVTSRGCPGTCTFCYTKTMWGYKWTSRSAEKVVEEIEWLRDIDPRVGGVIFDDDLFAGDPRRIARFSDLLQERHLDIAWNCEIRAKDVRPELVDQMKRGGCRELLLGVESGSQKLLDSLCKGLKVEEIEEAFRIAHEGGLEAVAMLMVGVPGETAEDFRRTRELLRRIRPDGYYFSLYIPAPGTKFIEVAKAHGFEEPKDLEGWAEMGTFSMADYERRSYSSVPKAKVEALIASEQKRIRREKNMTALRSDPIGAIGRTIVRGLGGEPRSPPSDR